MAKTKANDLLVAWALAHFALKQHMDVAAGAACAQSAMTDEIAERLMRALLRATARERQAFDDMVNFIATREE